MWCNKLSKSRNGGQSDRMPYIQSGDCKFSALVSSSNQRNFEQQKLGDKCTTIKALWTMKVFWMMKNVGL